MGALLPAETAAGWATVVIRAPMIDLIDSWTLLIAGCTALVLAGLNVSSLSMAPGALAGVGRSLVAVSLEQCRRVARAACDSDSPATAREAVRAALNS